MLSKKHRVSKEKNIKKILRQGKFASKDFLTIKYIPNKLDFTRFATPVGLKISKKATVRNKIKRRLQEAIRLKLDKIRKGYDVLVMVDKAIKDKSYQEIDRALTDSLNKARLLKKG